MWHSLSTASGFWSQRQLLRFQQYLQAWAEAEKLKGKLKAANLVRRSLPSRSKTWNGILTTFLENTSAYPCKSWNFSINPLTYLPTSWMWYNSFAQQISIRSQRALNERIDLYENFEWKKRRKEIHIILIERVSGLYIFIYNQGTSPLVIIGYKPAVLVILF